MTTLKTFSLFLQSVRDQIQKPHQFSPFHKALRTPADYYMLGLDFVRPLIDYKNSTVLGKDALDTIQKEVDACDNVVLFSNHQTEIDPQIISLLLDKKHSQLAQEMIFVAGHLVVTDPLAVPLSLGRNLLCIYSKRHIDHPPEKKAEKLAHNQKAIKMVGELLDWGGQCIYIAPSGGRDRANEAGFVTVAPFDQQHRAFLPSVTKGKAPYPLSHPCPCYLPAAFSAPKPGAAANRSVKDNPF